MPLRRLAGRTRSETANRSLGALLALTAGTVDVSGFLAYRQFTSHMSGLTATIAATLVTEGPRVILRPLSVLCAFLAGAALCSVLVNWSCRRDHESLFALPLLLESALLALIPLIGPLIGPLQGSLLTPLLGTRFPTLTPVPLLLALMAFTMGLQNAASAKLSGTQLRTTHVTGMVTDIGIELGRALYWNRSAQHEPIRSHVRLLALKSLLVALFLLGGIVAAFGFPRFGLRLLWPFALALAAVTVAPVAADLRPRSPLPG